MAQKIPPPPPIASKDPAFNRWLLELTSILNNSGGIDPDSIAGLTEAYAQIAQSVIDIHSLQLTVIGQSGSIAGLQSQVTTNTNAIATVNGQLTTINAQILALQARSQILNGSGVPGAGLGANGDLYLNNTGGAGTRLYGKIGGAWIAIA